MTAKNQKIDDFGYGRLTATNEISDWVQSNIDKIKAIPVGNADTHKRATLSGEIKILSNLKQYLKVKVRKIKDNAKPKI